MLTIPLVPKNPNGPLKVILIGRVSTIHQDKENIEASFRYDLAFLHANYSGISEIKCMGEQASGMLAGRATIVEACNLIESEQWDLVLVEDLSRIFRNPRFQWAFLQDCVDHLTRVICIADNIDTADPNWEANAHTATLRHGLAVPDARRRVRRTADHAFARGGMVFNVKYGYRKLTKEEADSGDFGPKGLRIAIRPECTPIIRAMRARILRGDSCDSIAAWLQEEGVETAPKVRSSRWSGKLVADLLRDPILCGVRRFKRTICIQVYRTGKYRRAKNPEGPEESYYQELQHMTKDEHSEMLTAMDARSRGATSPSGPANPLWRRPRSDSFWPGQHPTCAICGGRLYRYGRNLRCKNTVSKGPKTCWFHGLVSIKMVHEKVLRWLLRSLKDHPGAHNALITAAVQEFERARRRNKRSSADLAKRIADLESQARLLANAIAKGGELEALVDKSREVASALTKARADLAACESDEADTTDFVTHEEVAARLDQVVFHLANSSFEFAQFMRRLIPKFVVQPVQQLDCGLVRSRAIIVMRPDAWASEGESTEEISVEIDLFEPPVHIRYLQPCVDIKESDPNATLDQIAAALQINRMTVKRALAYHRLMIDSGLTEPYRVINEKPQSASRWLKRAG